MWNMHSECKLKLGWSKLGARVFNIQTTQIDGATHPGVWFVGWIIHNLTQGCTYWPTDAKVGCGSNSSTCYPQQQRGISGTATSHCSAATSGAGPVVMAEVEQPVASGTRSSFGVAKRQWWSHQSFSAATSRPTGCSTSAITASGSALAGHGSRNFTRDPLFGGWSVGATQTSLTTWNPPASGDFWRLNPPWCCEDARVDCAVNMGGLHVEDHGEICFW